MAKLPWKAWYDTARRRHLHKLVSGAASTSPKGVGIAGMMRHRANATVRHYFAIRMTLY